jgi:hypothetical protein
MGFLSNVTTVLPLSGLVEGHRVAFSRSEELSPERVLVQTPSKWQDRLIIRAKRESYDVPDRDH